jgi:hypothetical protein
MFELIGMILTLGTAGLGYAKARDFVATRLRYVDAVQHPAAPIIAGAGAAVVALPIVAFVPLVGAGTAMLFGAAVGMGTHAGLRENRPSV